MNVRICVTYTITHNYITTHAYVIVPYDFPYDNHKCGYVITINVLM